MTDIIKDIPTISEQPEPMQEPMDAEGKKKQDTPQQDNPPEPSKVTITTQTPIPSAGDEYRRMAGEIDTSEGAVNRTSAVADIIRQGREATEYYREKAKQNDRAGRFAAWTQFASALANMAGWGGSQPIQQDTSVPLTAMRKADEYRNIMEQTGRQYSNAANSARQAEIQRRQQQRQSLLELAEKADRDAYQFGTKTATEYNPSQDERNNAMAEYYRRRAAGTGARSTKLSEMTPIDQFGNYGINGAETPEWLRGRRIYATQLPEIVGRIREFYKKAKERLGISKDGKIPDDADLSGLSEMEKALLQTENFEGVSGLVVTEDDVLKKIDKRAKEKAGAPFKNASLTKMTDLEKAVSSPDDIEVEMALMMNIGELDASKINWLHRIILTDPDVFRDILTNDEAGFRRTKMSGESGQGDYLSEEAASQLFPLQ